jgi:hypothetical protein
MCASRGTILMISVVVAADALLGCSRGPIAIKVPPIKPEAAAEGALSLYDKNGDGLLVADELASCPALVDALKNHIDKNNDQRLSKDELTERFAMWAHGGVGLSYLICRVTVGGRPLAGAQVRLIPETFFDGIIQPAEGTTGSSGSARLAIDKSNLPSDLQGFRGVQQGLYRVEITHQGVNIPAKYNAATTLGVEVSFESGRNVVSFNL